MIFICMVELWFASFEYYPYIQMWQHMLLCGVWAKPVAHLMQYHLLQWEVAKVKVILLRYNSPTYCNNMLYRWLTTGSFQPE